ncbi:PPOX class F420-dependent oxidoreductase [Catenulispora sp. NL8]|uniref:PPOX class F420-dependent oxidoreductase n=1 Tax=Catenulispora pinistramenti TaxID=2705254 RepID=A0ABS5KZC3_9ACTN|nr:PPOX class F420-dependent oxidoreductase [Catenulispora pinistramenti]MBS2551420.1 PPOX class F420-dependent oxidoreductase [Catenulispora pinistramenti]
MDAFLELLKERGQATLATIKKDGRPQLSVINYAYDPAEQVIRVSIIDGRAKTHNLRRDPRVTLMVQPDTYQYAVYDGDAELSAVAQSPDDAAVEELVALYRAAAGKEHPDWDEYRAAMIADKRLVLRIRVTHAYGMGI